jgi:molybdate transport system substrate-binding protein
MFCQTGFSAEIYWYLAASMSEPGKEIVRKFNTQSKNCKVYLVLGGSGGLLSRITVSDKGDLYTPGSTFFLRKAEKLGIVKKTRLLLLQRMVIGLSSGGIKKIHSFGDLTKSGIRIAFGSPKLTALGKVFLRMKRRMSPEFLRCLEKNKVVEGINANQIANYILSDTVDAGFIFDTVAKVNKIPYIVIPEKFNASSEAYIILLRSSKNYKETNEFIDFVFKQNDIFAQYGYSLIKSDQKKI